MAQADEIVDAVNDMINKRIAARNETDERKKSTMTREVMSETIPATLVRSGEPSGECRKCGLGQMPQQISSRFHCKYSSSIVLQ